MVKKMLLCFLCLYLLLSVFGCKEESTGPSIPELIKPTIEYFTTTPDSIILGDSSTLSWSVTNATTVSINQGIGIVSAAGTIDVSPMATTTYALTASNNDGRNSLSCTVEIIKWAVLQYSTIPADPEFIYDPGLNETISTFVAVFTETVGVGGQLDKISFTPCPTGLPYEFIGGTFDAFGSFSFCCDVTMPGKATCFSMAWQGIDDNGYTIDESAWFNISWDNGTGHIALLRIVEEINHHKLIR